MEKLARIVILLTLFAFCAFAHAANWKLHPRYPQSGTQKIRLLELSRQYAEQWETLRGAEYQRLQAMTTGPQGVLNLLEDIVLIGIAEDGRPVFYCTCNLNSARTLSVDRVWPLGETGYDISGSNTTDNMLALWDAGRVRSTHQEFGDRVTLVDAGNYSGHATHVAGTMIAAGENPEARGMSFEAELSSYNFINDNAEMAAAATEGLRVSNHSYALMRGWRRSNDEWYWYGDPNVSETEDYYFGFYSSGAAAWDRIALNAPYYTIVTATANYRGVGPEPGTEHYVWQNGAWRRSTTIRDRIGGEDGFDSIVGYAVAKNAITVGAIYDLPDGYTSPEDVEMTTFSGWGPCDDGRIKPEFVTSGVGVFSCTAASDTSYSSNTATSYCTPSFTGSANLLVEFYAETHDDDLPRAATIKAVLMNTAGEAGPDPGPDYMFGWGVPNIRNAADLIQLDADLEYPIIEEWILDEFPNTYYFISDGTEPVCVSLAWTDPPGTVPDAELNPRTPVLVNDLDLRLIYDNDETEYFPYVLDPENPSEAAVQSDNEIDNAEQIYVEEPEAGLYRVVISNDGQLTNGFQDYSLVVSGLEMDELVTPGDLQAELDSETGEVTLTWNHPDAERLQQAGGLNELDEFLFFKMIRNYSIIDSIATGRYIDRLTEEGLYVYKVRAVYETGISGWSDTVQVDYEIDAVGSGGMADIPSEWVLSIPYPNPFNPIVRFRVGLPINSLLSVEVFNVLGQRVSILADGQYQPGHHKFTFKASKLTSGIYIIHASVPGKMDEVRKVVLMK